MADAPANNKDKKPQQEGIRKGPDTRQTIGWDMRGGSSDNDDYKSAVSHAIEMAEKLKYPDDLATSADDRGYTMFFISSRTNRKIVGHVEGVKVDAGIADKGVALHQSNYQSKAQQARYSLGLQNAIIGKEAMGGVTKMGTALAALWKSGKKSAGGAAMIVGGAIASDSNLAASIVAGNRQVAGTSQLNKTIILPTPQINATYNTSWQEGEGLNHLVLGLAEAGMQDLDGKNWIDQIVERGGTAFDGLTAHVSRNNLINNVVGSIPNPLKEQYFTDVAFRTFTFNYTMIPRDIGEWTVIQNIIRMFKVNALPETQGHMWVYPSEFDIVHMVGGEENPNLPRHATSILESVTATYGTGNAQVWHTGGIPTQVNLTLNFKELVIVDAEMANQGY